MFCQFFKHKSSNLQDCQKKENIHNEIFEEAIRKLKDGEISEGRKLLFKLASNNIESPELFNLLGISYEMSRDKLNALKYYRIAYYLDQSFTPAVETLHRASNFYSKKMADINWGVEEEQ